MERETLWRLDELVRRVGAALAAAPYPGQSSGRIRDVPDSRTIRYYTTLGILDRPAEMRGRVAFYGRRHLLQLVAIKRLQAQGRSLVDIQAKLTAVSNKVLERLTELPADYQTAPGPINDSSDRRQTSFWTATPAAKSSAATDDSEMAAVTVSPAIVLRLAPGVTLTLNDRSAVEFDPQKLAAIRPLIERLLAELQRPSADKR